ncbi:hypothetical protein [Bergeyella zoohelcum]|uniref:hypothetical protein n=1 Tax=Bergeyella zoohelcum TaxID=1015 RepID=UPI000E1FDAA7|nr:hypothetical protein [Bergeyella zoohelcum]
MSHSVENLVQGNNSTLLLTHSPATQGENLHKNLPQQKNVVHLSRNNYLFVGQTRLDLSFLDINALAWCIPVLFVLQIVVVANLGSTTLSLFTNLLTF